MLAPDGILAFQSYLPQPVAGLVMAAASHIFHLPGTKSAFNPHSQRPPQTPAPSF